MVKHFEASLIVDQTGRLPLKLGERVRDVLKALAGKPIHFVIEDQKRYSTNPQRQYYFGVIVTQFQEYFSSHGMWYDKDDLHDMMMKEIVKLWIEEPNPFTGDIQKKRRSYNNLSTIEAENYHTLCRAEAAKRGFDIPEPHENELKE